MITRLFTLWIALALVIFTGSVSAAPNSDRHVILISIDGFANYYLDDPIAVIPTIRGLADKGARAKSMQTAFPTVTWTNHTTLITGVLAGRHGVIGNSYYDREQGKVIPLLPDPLLDKIEIVKVPTLYDVVHGAGLTTGGVCWPASRNAPSWTWAVPDVFDQTIFENASTPSLLAELKEKSIPYWKQNEWCRAGNAGKPQRDWMYTSIAKHLIRAHQPNLIALHLMTPDAMGHSTGRQTEEAYWGISDSDRCVRDLVDAVEAAGLADKTTFIVTSDHGFISFTKQILPNIILRQEGLREGTGADLKSKVYFLSQGGAAFLYVLDEANREAIISQMAKRFRDVEGIETVIEPKDFAKFGHQLPSENPHEPDLMLAAKDGYSFSGKDEGDDIINTIDGQRGDHGYSPFNEQMDGIFVAAGAGIKPGVVLDQIHNTDVAPTAAALLGLKMENVDGKVLTEILSE